MIEHKFPGKLFLIGEYTIMEPGNKAIIAAINRYIRSRIEESEEFLIVSSHGILTAENMFSDSGSMRYVSETLRYLKKFLSYDKPFKLVLESDLEGPNGEKYGFGSSGVVIVAVIKALLDFYKIKNDKLMIFKMGVCIQFGMGDFGSGGDLASTLFGGVISYTRFDEKWVKQNLSNNDLVTKDWPKLSINNLDYEELKLIVGWTQKANATSPFVKEYLKWGSHNSDKYLSLNYKAQQIVNRFERALKFKNDYELKTSISSYKSWMTEMSTQVGISVDTQDLNHLIEIANNLGYSGKISGAGGGDCGIVCDFNIENENLAKLSTEWKKHGILMLDIEVV